MPASKQQLANLPDYSAACGSVHWVVGGAGATNISAEIIANGGAVLPPNIEAQKAWLDSVLQGHDRHR
jgi:hypothetical protein